MNGGSEMAAAREVSAESPDSLPPVATRASFFQRCDWLAFWLTAGCALFTYLLTLAPEVTLEFSGIFSTAALYGGVAHPPGYPLWTVWAWLFTNLLPFGNIAWRAAVSSAVAGALACGTVALMVSRAGAGVLDGMRGLRRLEGQSEMALRVVCGFVAGMALGLDRRLWMRAVIVESTTLSVALFALVLCLLLRWARDPERHCLLYAATLLFGLDLTVDLYLVITLPGLVLLILLNKPALGRDFLFAIAALVGLLLLADWRGCLPSPISDFMEMRPLINIYRALAIGAAMIGGVAAIATLIRHNTKPQVPSEPAGRENPVTAPSPSEGEGDNRGQPRTEGSSMATPGQNNQAANVPLPLSEAAPLAHSAAPEFSVGPQSPARRSPWSRAARAVSRSSWPTVTLCSSLFLLGLSFYFYIVPASMATPPVNWSYARTVDGFFHAVTRGQYDRLHPQDDFAGLLRQAGQYCDQTCHDFGLIFVLPALVPLFAVHRMRRCERAWILGLLAPFLCLSFWLVVMLNPAPYRAYQDLVAFYYIPSHLILALWAGYGLCILGTLIVGNWLSALKWARERGRSV